MLIVNIMLIQFRLKEIKKNQIRKEKGAEFFLENKEAIKEKPKNQYENLSKKEKD